MRLFSSLRWFMLQTVLVVALGLPAGAVASPPEASEPARPDGPAYVFVAGDVLEITVEPQKGYDRVVTIQPDGYLTFPIVGEVRAAGLTARELTRWLEQGLQAELKRPRVTVALKEINKGLLRRVSVLGAVKTPGVYELKERSTLAELLATAGGTTPVADLRRVTITRADGSKKVVADLSSATREGDVGDNLLLEPGDLIVVPEGVAPVIVVLGEVVRPGSYELRGEMRVLDALSQAGGPTPKADLQRAMLIRAGEATKISLDLSSLLSQSESVSTAANVVLQPGDTLVLPESELKYYVLGEVHKAEAYPLKPRTRLLDAIATAGGVTREADLAKVVLVRKDETHQPVARAVDVAKMMKSGDMSLNSTLQAGDVIFVPSRKQGRRLPELLGVLYPISALLNVFR